jgi:heme/copper-type cytochrome/quinol oxidase subunit 2
VTAVSGTLTATAQVTVTPGKLASITISPTEASVEVDRKVKFTVTSAKDAKGNDIAIASLTVIWSVQNSSIGTIANNGEFTGAKEGSSSVTASASDGKATRTATAQVTVKPKTLLGGIDTMSLLLLFLIIIIVVVAAVVALVAIRRKRKRREREAMYQGYPGYGQQPMYPDQMGYPPQGPPPPQF